MTPIQDRIRELIAKLSSLTPSQLGYIDQIATQLNRAYLNEYRNPNSDLVSQCLIDVFGDALRIHHCFSKEALSKDRFEHALERAVNLCSGYAELAPRGNPGHDITINGKRFSLKTEAAREIKENQVHISKFMELGKGDWDFELLRQRFVTHLRNYERIITLRCLSKSPHPWRYQLVEIPKKLLLEAKNGVFRTPKSTQEPKPGYCDVSDKDKTIRYQLYFDAGSERKLQIKKIRIELCVIHAEWTFRTDDLTNQ